MLSAENFAQFKNGSLVTWVESVNMPLTPMKFVATGSIFGEDDELVSVEYQSDAHVGVYPLEDFMKFTKLL